MRTTWDQLDWYKPDITLRKQLVAFVLSVVLVVLILLIPVTLNTQLINNESSIEVELRKSQPPIAKQNIVEPPKPEPKPIQQQSIETKPIEKPVETPKPIESVKEAPKQVPVKVETVVEPIVEKKLPNSAVILKSLYDGKPKLNPIGEEFQARTKDPYDYVYQIVEAPKWNQVTKLIDEDVDKPRIEMGFYPLGFDGAVEKFMDKITYKKTFTTKYGTKIGCAITIIIAGCGWK